MINLSLLKTLQFELTVAHFIYFHLGEELSNAFCEF